MKQKDASSCHFQCSLRLGTGSTHKPQLEFKGSLNDIAVNDILFSLNLGVATSKWKFEFQIKDYSLLSLWAFSWKQSLFLRHKIELDKECS